MKLQRIGIIALAAVLPLCGIAHAVSIDFSGISPNWSVTAGGAIDVAPLHVMGNGFSITSNNVSTGIPGAWAKPRHLRRVVGCLLSILLAG
jgi:hypothetical protein